jgi:hypothetical protein
MRHGEHGHRQGCLKDPGKGPRHQERRSSLPLARVSLIYTTRQCSCSGNLAEKVTWSSGTLPAWHCPSTGWHPHLYRYTSRGMDRGVKVRPTHTGCSFPALPFCHDSVGKKLNSTNLLSHSCSPDYRDLCYPLLESCARARTWP